MGEDQGVVRMNISVPRDLKARMDAVKQPVNWSQTAAQAFEAKLLDLEATKEVETMDDVIARLRAAAKQEENEDYQDGLKAGRAWAMEDAKPKELRRIANYVEGSERDRVCWWDIDGDTTSWDAPYGATDNFVMAIWPEAKNDDSLLTTFWEEALGEDAGRVEDAQFFHGFGDGVGEVWKQVRHKL
jgi:hypothetical protein